MQVVCNPIVDRVFKGLCKALDTPVTLGAWLRYKYGEHKQLAELTVNPKDYCDVDGFRKDYLVSEYLSKFRGLEMPKVDTRAVALGKFKESEEICRESNIRLRKYKLRGLSPDVQSVIQRAQRKIASLIGECPPDDWYERCKWGPGATHSITRDRSQLDNKLLEEPMSITPFAVRHLRRVLSQDLVWASALLKQDVEGPFCALDCCFDQVQGSTYFTVLKNLETDRSALKEATANGFLQRGLGITLREALLKVGIDLRDQTVNQRAAQLAYARGDVTVDLKSASDLVCREGVRTLFPAGWYQLLDDLRSHAYLEKGEWLPLEKFSSMGNGFTFELETLIYWALSQSVIETLHLGDGRRRSRALVYGDDIILPSAALPLLRETFAAFGFIINEGKTHYESAFRESCGKHYFAGYDVTPVYQKEPLPDLDPCDPLYLAERYRFANRLLRLSLDWGGGEVLDARLRPAITAALDGLALKHVVPIDAESDDGVALPLRMMPAEGVKPLQAFRPNKRFPNYQDGGVACRVLSFKSVKRVARGQAMVAYFLRKKEFEAIPMNNGAFDDLEWFRQLEYNSHLMDDSPFNGKVVLSALGKASTRWRQYPGRRWNGPWSDDLD